MTYFAQRPFYLNALPTDLGFDVTIRCRGGRLRAVVELAEELRERPDAREIAVSMMAEKHDQLCAQGCVDTLKVAERIYPTYVPEVRLEIGNATVAVGDVPGVVPPTIFVELACQHKVSEIHGEVRPGVSKLDAHLEVIMEAARKHREHSTCGCVPDPDDGAEWE